MYDAASHSQEFDAFLARYQPVVRPDGTLERMRRAFEIDVSFLEGYQLLRPYLKRYEVAWSLKIIDYVGQARSAQGAFDPEHQHAFATLYRRHAQALVLGQFDGAYLDTVEEVALFMIHRDIKSVWLAGAYQQILGDMVDFIFERTEKHRPGKMRNLVKALSKTVAIEMNQIQRVFTVYETRRLEETVRDLTAGGSGRVKALARSGPLSKITPRQVALAQENFQVVAAQAELAGRKFYEKLFERHEALKPRFPENMAEQQKKFMAALAFVVEGLSAPETIVREIEEMGVRHGAYGVTPEEYDVVEDAFLWVLERASGPRWSHELKQAWTAIYRALAETMIAAAKG